MIIAKKIITLTPIQPSEMDRVPWRRIEPYVQYMEAHQTAMRPTITKRESLARLFSKQAKGPKEPKEFHVILLIISTWLKKEQSRIKDFFHFHGPFSFQPWFGKQISISWVPQCAYEVVESQHVCDYVGAIPSRQLCI